MLVGVPIGNLQGFLICTGCAYPKLPENESVILRGTIIPQGNSQYWDGALFVKAASGKNSDACLQFHEANMYGSPESVRRQEDDVVIIGMLPATKLLGAIT